MRKLSIHFAKRVTLLAFMESEKGRFLSRSYTHLNSPIEGSDSNYSLNKKYLIVPICVKGHQSQLYFFLANFEF